MRNNTFLISADYIKKHSVISENVDEKYLSSAINDAQNTGLEPMIGTRLFRKLSQLVATDQIYDEANYWYKRLLDQYILDYLQWKVCATIQLDLFAKMRNSGIVTYQDQNQQPLSIKDVQWLIDHYEQKASFYGTRMLEYLVSESKYYPEFSQKDKAYELSPDEGARYKCPINL